MNITVDQEVYIYHKEKGTKLSTTINQYLKELMLNNEKTLELAAEEERLETLKQELRNQMVKVTSARQNHAQAIEEQQKQKEAENKERMFKINTIEEYEYWKETKQVLERNPELKEGRYKYFTNVFNDQINYDDWKKKLEMYIRGEL